MVKTIIKYVGFKTNAEMQEFMEKNKLKSYGSGYDTKNKHFFESDKNINAKKTRPKKRAAPRRQTGLYFGRLGF